MSNLRVLATGLEFPEGPVVMPDGSVVLGPGGSLSFWATQPHRVVNTSTEQAAVALWLTVRHARPEVPSIGGLETGAALLEELAAQERASSDQLPRYVE